MRFRFLSFALMMGCTTAPDVVAVPPAIDTMSGADSAIEFDSATRLMLDAGSEACIDEARDASIDAACTESK